MNSSCAAAPFTDSEGPNHSERPEGSSSHRFWTASSANNHPSGTAEPSPQDVSMTGRVRGLLDEVDVRPLDHIVVSRTETVSMAARDLI